MYSIWLENLQLTNYNEYIGAPIGDEAQMISVFFIGCLHKPTALPTPTWYQERAYTSDGQLCASGHHEYVGNLTLSKSSSAQRARRKLASAMAEQMMPYREQLDASLDIEIQQILWNPSAPEESVFEIPYTSDIRTVELLPSPQNPQVLWSEVCFTGTITDLVDEVNRQVLLQQSNFSEDDINMKITPTTNAPSIEEQLHALKQTFYKTNNAI